jgi:pimeloyl-ACP methyl ester carboxylesterase
METVASQVARLDLGERSLAYRRSEGKGPTVVFLCGFRSDMSGTKATSLEAHCHERGRAFVRFDYRGHGLSSGRFEEGCIGDWLDDTLAVLDGVVPGRFVRVGSSMGGWLALLAGPARPERLAGLVGVASAPDFTADLIEPAMSPEQKEALATEGVFLAPSEYGEPVPITRRLLEDGRRHLVLREPIPLACPVHLLHGQLDPDVPWQTSLRLAASIETGTVTVELVKDGDHRLSRPEDLRRIHAAVDRVIELADQNA